MYTNRSLEFVALDHPANAPRLVVKLTADENRDLTAFLRQL
jgi:hypothetical protein